MKKLLLLIAVLMLSTALAEEVTVTVEVLPPPEVPEYGLRATAFAIARVNPLATILLILMPVIIAEFLIREFEAIKLSEPLKAFVRLIVIITSLALFATII